MTRTTRFGQFLETMEASRMGEVDALYAEELDFKDPMNEATTREHFKRIEEDLFKQLKDVSFTVQEVCGDDHQGMVNWLMTYKFRRKERQIAGVSHVKFNEEGEINFQHDYWDASFAVYGEFPGIGLMMKGIKKMLRVK